ncbi:MAG TPA: UbiA family prenyltransferase [Nocardioides sp.]|nr:UbiA family prenyltransferase [Nocardioides sp.]
MAILRRKGRGRSAGEDTTPVDEELGTDPIDDSEHPGAAEEPEDLEDGEEAEGYADEPEPADEEPSEEDLAEEDLAEDTEVEDTEDEDATAEPEPDDEPADDLAIDENPVVERPRRGLRGSLVLSLSQAAHLKQAVVTALVVGGVAMAAGRSAREVGIVILTVLTGQVILGWHNDLTDRLRDHRLGTPGKPLADGRLEPGTVWYAIVVAALVLVPLAVTTGITAGCLYLASVAIGMLGNVTFRKGILSWWSWAVSFGLLPYYLSYGGWGGKFVGTPPEPAIVVLAALLGIGIHFMRSVWGLVGDHEEGWTYLPLKLAMKVGATRLLALSTTYTVAIAVAMVVVGAQVGLSR